MPLTCISSRRSWPERTVQALMEAVHAAQREALQIPEHDRNIRYMEYPPERFHVPPARTEDFVLIEITLFSGRSLDAKRQLYSSIVANLGKLDIAPDDIFIVLHEVPLENWGIRGGLPASEVALGFKVDL